MGRGADSGRAVSGAGATGAGAGGSAITPTGGAGAVFGGSGEIGAAGAATAAGGAGGLGATGFAAASAAVGLAAGGGAAFATGLADARLGRGRGSLCLRRHDLRRGGRLGFGGRGFGCGRARLRGAGCGGGGGCHDRTLLVQVSVRDAVLDRGAFGPEWEQRPTVRFRHCCRDTQTCNTFFLKSQSPWRGSGRRSAPATVCPVPKRTARPCPACPSTHPHPPAPRPCG